MFLSIFWRLIPSDFSVKIDFQTFAPCGTRRD